MEGWWKGEKSCVHSNDLRSILPTHTATRTVLNVYYVFMQAGPGVLMPSVYHPSTTLPRMARSRDF